MGACRNNHGRVRCWIKHEKRNSISTSNHVLFCYHINTIALYWEEKPTSLINENGCNFQFTKFSFIDFVLTKRRSLSGKLPKSASGKSSSCGFSFLAERNAIIKATEYATFGFSFSILVFFPFWECLNLIVCQWYRFFSALAAIIIIKLRQTTCIENREGFAVQLSTWPSGTKGEWKQLIGYIDTRKKKYDIFSRALLRLFSGPEILASTPLDHMNATVSLDILEMEKIAQVNLMYFVLY